MLYHLTNLVHVGNVQPVQICIPNYSDNPPESPPSLLEKSNTDAAW